MRNTAADILGPLDGLTAAQISARFQTIMAAEEWAAPQLSDAMFSEMVRTMYARPRMFTYIDLFCGAGGSSIGLTMAGGHLLLAANHSKRAIETHSANFPDSEHACADLNHYDMRKLPLGAQVLWASPICTEISPAGGRKRTSKNRSSKNRTSPDQQELMKFGPVPKDVFERTRATAHDVIRATELHRFPMVIVENVVEFARDWELFGWWLDGMKFLGYQHQIVCVSSAHVGGPTNPHAPQRRDRLYVVFNRKDVARPDVEPRPLSRCGTCGDVAGMQWWKKPDGDITASGRRFRVGKYGVRTGQYVYRCPNAECKHSIVTPYERPAASVIDWSDLGVRIGDRAKGDELSPNTIRRIERGLRMFGRPIHATVAGNTYERPGYTRAWPADLTPFMARTQTASDALACPPLLVNSNHDDDRAYPADRTPFPSRTTKIGDGIATTGGCLVKNYGGNADDRDMVKPLSEPFATVTTKDHHGVAFLDANGGNWNTEPAPVTEPFRTRTTREWEALVTMPAGAMVDTLRNNATPRPASEPFTTVAAGGNHHGLVVPYYTKGRATSTDEPFPTTTVKDRFGLASGDDLDVMQAFYRMVQWHEQARAQRFPACYEITGNLGERTAQAGNAVSCNVAQWLGERVSEALNRTAAQV